MKLSDIPPGSELAYRRAAKLLSEQIEFELETCRQLYGTDPERVLALLASTSDWTDFLEEDERQRVSLSCTEAARTSASPSPRSYPARSTQMTCVVCGGAVEEGFRHGVPPKEAKYCLKCRPERQRRANAKYVWRPEFDEHLKAQYYGGLNRRFRVLNRLIRLTGLPRWYIKRQAARLGLTMHLDRKPWSAAEVAVLEQLTGTVSTATIAKRLRRPEASVVNKLKRLRISRRVREGYTMRDLELCLGEDHHKIGRWIASGWLHDHLQGTRRHDGNGKDIHRIRDKDILAFLRCHPQEINLGKVDQTWFLDLVLLKGREAPEQNSRRKAESNVEAAAD